MKNKIKNILTNWKFLLGLFFVAALTLVGGRQINIISDADTFPGIRYSKNYVLNPDFERTNTLDWVSSSGPIALQTSQAATDKLNGRAWAKWSPGALNATLKGSLRAIDAGLAQGLEICQVEVRYNYARSGSAGEWGYQLYFEDSGSVRVSEILPLLSTYDALAGETPKPRKALVQVPCNKLSGGKPVFKYVSTSASDLLWDDTSVGPVETTTTMPVGVSHTTYVPTLTGITALNATAKVDPQGTYYIKDGWMDLQIGFRNGTGGAASGAAGDYVAVGIPPGIQLDTANMIGTMGGYRVEGACYVSGTSNGASAAYFNGTQFLCVKSSTSDWYKVSDFVASATLSLRVRVPVLGFPAQPVTVPTKSADLLGTHFYTGDAQCPVNSVEGGSIISRTAYASLFAKWGTTFGAGDGSTTFGVPKSNGIYIVGMGSQTINSVTYTMSTRGALRSDAMQRIQATFNNIHGNGLVGIARSGASYTGAFSQGPSLGSWSPSGGNVTGYGLNFDSANVTRIDTTTHGADIALRSCFWAVSTPYLPVAGGVSTKSQLNEGVNRATVTCSASSQINRGSGWVTSITNAVDGGAYRECTISWPATAVLASCSVEGVQSTKGVAVNVQQFGKTVSGVTLVGPDSDFVADIVCMFQN